VRHACTVGLDEHVVDEEDGQVDAHHARKLLRAFGVGVVRAQNLDWVE
jgi:hypothetical protein